MQGTKRARVDEGATEELNASDPAMEAARIFGCSVSELPIAARLAQRSAFMRNYMMGKLILSPRDYWPRGVLGFVEYMRDCQAQGYFLVPMALDHRWISMSDFDPDRSPKIRAAVREWKSCHPLMLMARTKFFYRLANKVYEKLVRAASEGSPIVIEEGDWSFLQDIVARYCKYLRSGNELTVKIQETRTNGSTYQQDRQLFFKRREEEVGNEWEFFDAHWVQPMQIVKEDPSLSYTEVLSKQAMQGAATVSADDGFVA